MLSDDDKIFSYRELREEKEKQAIITIQKRRYGVIVEGVTRLAQKNQGWFLSGNNF